MEVGNSTGALLTLQFPLGLFEKVFVSPRLFSPRALFLRSTFWMGSRSRFPRSPPSRRGGVLYIYLLMPDVLLDEFLVLDGVLAHPYLCVLATRPYSPSCREEFLSETRSAEGSNLPHNLSPW